MPTRHDIAAQGDLRLPSTVRPMMLRMARTTQFPGGGQWRIMASVYPAKLLLLHVDGIRNAGIGSVMLLSTLRQSHFVNGAELLCES